MCRGENVYTMGTKVKKIPFCNDDDLIRFWLLPAPSSSFFFFSLLLISQQSRDTNADARCVRSRFLKMEDAISSEFHLSVRSNGIKLRGEGKKGVLTPRCWDVR